MTAAYGDVPLLDPTTGRFPDSFAPPSVAAAVADAQTARQGAEAARDEAVGLIGDVAEWDARVAAAEAAVSVAVSTRAFKHERPRDTQALTAYRKTGAQVSFVDDDGNTPVLTKLVPLSEAHAIPFTIAIPSTLFADAGKLTAQQIKALQDDRGWEIASHGRTHVPITDALTDDQIESEIAESATDLRALGFDVTTLVWPYGQSSATSRGVASQHYTAGCSTSAQFNKTPVKTYRLGRHEFPTAGWTLGQYTALVDQAIAGGWWLIFMLHCGTHTAADDLMLGDLIAYIKAASVPVVTVRDGIATHGNVIDIGDEERYWARDGSNNIVSFDFRPADPTTGNETFTIDTLPGDIPLGKTWIGAISTAAERAKTPTAGGGVLLASHEKAGYGYEMFYSIDTSWVRHENSAGTGWTAWSEVLRGAKFNYTMTARTIPANGVTDVTIYDAGYRANATYAASPTGTLEAGVVWSVWSHGDGAIKLRLANHTSVDASLAERVWRIRMLSSL